MERDTQIAQIISRFIDKPYAVDDEAKGYDCLNTLTIFFKEMGIELPHEFEDWTLTPGNYGARAMKDPDAAHKTFERFIQKIGEEVPISTIQRGDVLLFAVKELGTYAGLYLGNGNVLMVFDKGIYVSALHPFREYVKGVRRLLK